jgi:hypothetical protein
MNNLLYDDRIAFRIKSKDKQLLSELKELKSTSYSQIVRELLVNHLNSIKEKLKAKADK